MAIGQHPFLGGRYSKPSLSLLSATRANRRTASMPLRAGLPMLKAEGVAVNVRMSWSGNSGATPVSGQQEARLVKAA